MFFAFVVGVPTLIKKYSSSSTIELPIPLKSIMSPSSILGRQSVLKSSVPFFKFTIEA